MPTEQKIKEVEGLVEEFRDARSLILADFAGMDVATLSELRRRCRDEKVTFRVAKNTLMIRALDSLGMESLKPMLEGPTGYAVTTEDELAPARVLVGFAKEKELPRVKGGVVEGKVYSLDEIRALATLPPRNELLGQLLSTVQAPATNLLRALTGLMSDLVSILDQVAERGGAAAPATPAAETKEGAPAAETKEGAPVAETQEGAPVADEATVTESGEGAASAADGEKPEGTGGESPAGEDSPEPPA